MEKLIRNLALILFYAESGISFKKRKKKNYNKLKKINFVFNDFP
jgi:hypothetical protein